MQPCRFEANLPTKESGPYNSKILLMIANDAVPEIGLTKAIGKMLIGIPTLSNNGVKYEKINSKKWEFKNIFVANTIAITAGAILKVVTSPSLAPTKNES